ncbi:MAG: hypothetical protein WD009_14160 [Phycisphaeraceae bacterium]
MPDPTREFDRQEMNCDALAALEAVRAGLRHLGGDGPSVAEGILRSLRATHETIDRLVADSPDKAGPDALALTRLQIERTLLAALMADDPDRWVRIYLVASWRSDVIHALNMQGFSAEAQAWSDDHEAHLMELLKIGRHLKVREQDLQSIEQCYREGRVADDARFKLERAPNPSEIRRYIADPELRHLGSLFYCVLTPYNEWAHAGLGSATYQMIENRRSQEAGTTWDTYYYNAVVDRTLPYSWTAIMAVATLFANRFNAHHETYGSIVRGWRRVAEQHAIGVAVWDTWAKAALGVLG